MTRDNNNKLRAVFLAALMFLWLFAGTVAFAGAASAGSPAPAVINAADGDVFDGEEFNQGQEIRVIVDGEVPDGETLQLREVTDTDNGEPISTTRRASRTVSDGEVTFRTSTVPEGDYVLSERGNNEFYNNAGTPGDRFQPLDSDTDVASVVVQTIDVEFDDDEVRAGDDVELQFETEREGGEFDINITEDDLDAEELESIFDDLDGVVTTDAERFDGDDVFQLQGVDSFFEEDVTIGEDIAAQDYDFSFDVTDSTAEDNASLTVLEEIDLDADFDQGTFEENRGDVLEINATVEGDTDEELTVVVGEKDDDGYQANISVEPNDDGEISILLNTWQAGVEDGPVDSNAGFGNAEGDVDDTPVSMQEGDFVDYSEDTDGSTALEAVLESGVYDASILYDEETGTIPVDNVDFDGDDIVEFDVASIDLTERSTDGLNMWTAPGGQASDLNNLETILAGAEAGNVTETDTVAIADDDRDGARRGDLIIHQHEASGVFGLANEVPEDDLAEALYGATADNLDEQNFVLEYEQESPRQNRAPMVLDTESMDIEDDVLVIPDAENNTVYTVVDSDDLKFTRNGRDDGTAANQVGDAQDRVAPVDEEFEVTWNVTGNFADAFTRDDLVFDEDDEQTLDDLEIVDRELEFDTIDDNVTVPPSADAQISGDTTIAPGTEINIRARATGDIAFLRQAEDVEVSGDREFVGEVDFSDIESGTEFTASVRRQAFEDNAETNGIVGELEGPVFTVSDLEPQDAEVDQGDLIDVSATITNEGDEDGTQTVSLTLDGDELDSEEVELGEGDDTVVEFTDIDTSDLEGTYEHGIATDDDSATGTLVVNVDEPDTDDEEPPETDDEEPPETDDEEPPTDDDEPEPEDQVGFGAVVALVALLAAALLAARRNALN